MKLRLYWDSAMHGPAVLGIDAAWTEKHSSGVALVEQAGAEWRCVAVAPSYASFLHLSRGVPVDWSAPDRGSRPDPPALLTAASELLGRPFTGVVTVDMPVATVPVLSRRDADNAFQRRYGANGCGVHSSSPERPGRVSADLAAGFRALGYEVATASTPCATCGRLVEVYPHIPVMRLLGENYRVPYKWQRSTRYWPGVPAGKRRAKLLAIWARILDALKQRIAGIYLQLPSAGPLKRYEDALDGLVCAWVGIEYLAGRAQSYGDHTAAIWVPA
jgi:predicted RNase H-like nuclease